MTQLLRKYARSLLVPSLYLLFSAITVMCTVYYCVSDHLDGAGTLHKVFDLAFSPLLALYYLHRHAEEVDTQL